LNPNPPNTPEDEEEKPPFFSSWRAMYTFVLTFLAFLILLFYVFMKIFS